MKDNFFGDSTNYSLQSILMLLVDATWIIDLSFGNNFFIWSCISLIMDNLDVKNALKLTSVFHSILWRFATLFSQFWAENP